MFRKINFIRTHDGEMWVNLHELTKELREQGVEFKKVKT